MKKILFTITVFLTLFIFLNVKAENFYSLNLNGGDNGLWYSIPVNGISLDSFNSILDNPNINGVLFLEKLTDGDQLNRLKFKDSIYNENFNETILSSLSIFISIFKDVVLDIETNTYLDFESIKLKGGRNTISLNQNKINDLKNLLSNENILEFTCWNGGEIKFNKNNIQNIDNCKIGDFYSGIIYLKKGVGEFFILELLNKGFPFTFPITLS